MPEDTTLPEEQPYVRPQLVLDLLERFRNDDSGHASFSKADASIPPDEFEKLKLELQMIALDRSLVYTVGYDPVVEVTLIGWRLNRILPDGSYRDGRPTPVDEFDGGNGIGD